MTDWRPLKWVTENGVRRLLDTPRNADVLLAIASWPDDYGQWRWIKTVAHCDEYGTPYTNYGYGGDMWYWAPMPEDPPSDEVNKKLADLETRRRAQQEKDERELLASLQEKYGVLS